MRAAAVIRVHFINVPTLREPAFCEEGQVDNQPFHQGELCWMCLVFEKIRREGSGSWHWENPLEAVTSEWRCAGGAGCR